VHLGGLLGSRVDACRTNRILAYDENYLLWSYEAKIPVVPTGSTEERYYEETGPLRERRGEISWLYPRGLGPRPELTFSDWPGELVGQWVATASLMSYGAPDNAVLEKLEQVVERWLATQGPDGYLGVAPEY
jgi:hypothetical protein